ncbi:MAG: hypothetical protein E7238_07425 [Sarcina sp.]|nr:hypothetical protein [Sarcina sp.]
MIISILGIVVMAASLVLFLLPIGKIDLARAQASTCKDGIRQIREIYKGETIADDDERIRSLVQEEKMYLDQLERWLLLRKRAGIGILAGFAFMCLGALFSGGSDPGKKRCAICGKTENEVTLRYMSEDGEYYCSKHYQKAYDYYH